MLFELRKLVGGLAMPLSVALLLLLLGLILLWLRRQRGKQMLGRVCVLLGTLVLFLASSPWFAERLMAPLENQYPPVTDMAEWIQPVDDDEDDAGTHWIVVLGGGHQYHEDWSSSARLSESSLARLAEGVRLFHEARRAGARPGTEDPASTAGLDDEDTRDYPEVRLFVGGYGDQTTTAREMARTAEQWGVPRDRIVRAREAKSTAQEAAAFRAMRDQRAEEGHHDRAFHLVTSGYHLPRAMRLFQAQGLNPQPAPTHFQINPVRGERHIGHQLPQAGYLRMTERAWWEYLGRLWARLRGPEEAGADAWEVQEDGDQAADRTRTPGAARAAVAD